PHGPPPLPLPAAFPIFALAETDQRLSLFLHPPHREPSLAPIAPRRIGQRRQHRLGRDVADALEVFPEHALLGKDLLRLLQVLQRDRKSTRLNSSHVKTS